MRKISITLLLLVAVCLFQFCSSSKKVAAPVAVAVNYQNNIQSIIQGNCGPCHIAGKGNKKSLDNYVAAKETIDEIIERIQKNPGDHGFMPVRSGKLSDSTIMAFVEWKKAGLPEH